MMEGGDLELWGVVPPPLPPFGTSDEAGMAQVCVCVCECDCQCVNGRVYVNVQARCDICTGRCILHTIVSHWLIASLCTRGVRGRRGNGEVKAEELGNVIGRAWR